MVENQLLTVKNQGLMVNKLVNNNTNIIGCLKVNDGIKLFLVICFSHGRQVGS